MGKNIWEWWQEEKRERDYEKKTNEKQKNKGNTQGEFNASYTDGK